MQTLSSESLIYSRQAKTCGPASYVVEIKDTHHKKTRRKSLNPLSLSGSNLHTSDEYTKGCEYASCSSPNKYAEHI